MVSTKRKAPSKEEKKKNESKKEEKQKNERKRLCITSRKKNLHSPEIIPGRVREELLNEASTIKGVINLTVFSKELIDIILPAMNSVPKKVPEYQNQDQNTRFKPVPGMEV